MSGLANGIFTVADGAMKIYVMQLESYETIKRAINDSSRAKKTEEKRLPNFFSNNTDSISK